MLAKVVGASVAGWMARVPTIVALVDAVGKVGKRVVATGSLAVLVGTYVQP
jgi:hypothetical protein